MKTTRTLVTVVGANVTMPLAPRGSRVVDVFPYTTAGRFKADALARRMNQAYGIGVRVGLKMTRTHGRTIIPDKQQRGGPIVARARARAGDARPSRGSTGPGV